MSTNEPSLIKDFKRLAESGALGHGYLLYGESAASRRYIGSGLANFLETAGWDAGNSDTLVDGLLVKKDAAGSVGIDLARRVVEFLWQKPFKSSRRLAFIDDAETLTLQAQNALLKVVEEPPPHGLLVLSVLEPGALVPPLVSRLQQIYILPVKDNEEENFDSALAAKKFISGDARARKDIIAGLFDKEAELSGFVKALLAECRKDPVKNYELMKRVVDRWAKISQFNTNKKLQLETLM